MLFSGPVLLLPLHVVFLELIIDPACSLVFEAAPEPKDIMSRPPRPAQVRLVSWRSALGAVGVGALASLGVGAVQVLGHVQDWATPWLRFAALSSLVVSNLAMLAWFLGAGKTRAAWRDNRALLWLVLAICIGYALVLLITPLARQFGLPQGAGVQATVMFLLAAAAASAYRLRSASAGAAD